MKKRLPPLSESQMEIMNVVWEKGEATLADTWGALAEGRNVARNTVQTLLTRLVEKGWLKTRREGKVFHYSSAVPRGSAVSAALERFLKTTFGGSTEGLMLTLLEAESLSKEEISRLRQLIDEHEQKEAQS